MFLARITLKPDVLVGKRRSGIAEAEEHRRRELAKPRVAYAPIRIESHRKMCTQY